MATATVPFRTAFQYFVARGLTLSLQTVAGTSTGTTGSGDASNTNAPLHIGNNSNSNAGPAEMAEMIVVAGAVSDADVVKLVAYFHTKYGI